MTSTCVEYDPITVQVTPVIPPFTYSYQCTSELITSYTPVFLYSYVFLTVVPPLMYIFLLTFWPDPTSLPDFLRNRLPGLLYPYSWSTQQPLDVPITSTRQIATVSTPLRVEHCDACPVQDSVVDVKHRSSTFHVPSSALESDGTKEGKLMCTEARQLLRSDNILAPMLMHTSVLLTFGMCCPYLAVTICLAVAVAVVRWRLLLGRFILQRFNVALGYDVFAQPRKKDHIEVCVVKIQNDSGYCDVIDKPEVNGMDFCLVALNETVRDMHLTAGKCLWLQVIAKCPEN